MLGGLLTSVFSTKNILTNKSSSVQESTTAPTLQSIIKPLPLSSENPSAAQHHPLSTSSFRKNRITSSSSRKKHQSLQNLDDGTKLVVNIKIAILGLGQTGKTSLVNRFHRDRFSFEYVPTRMVCVDERRVMLRRGAANLALCDLGSADMENDNLLLLTCSDAQCILFCFDLTKRSSLVHLQDLYARTQKVNPRLCAAAGKTKPVPIILVGCKYDLFDGMDERYRAEMLVMARSYSTALRASALVFTSSKESINVIKLFKLVVGAVEDIECFVESRHAVGEPIIEY